MSEGAVRTRRTELLELDDMFHQLVETALKLAPGVERHNELVAIGYFRERIAAMKRAEADRARADVNRGRKASEARPRRVSARGQKPNSITSTPEP